ncbi:MAG: M20 family metallo-hydrolase [Bacteroidaceae bacterium]|nr:M20 family metallo-hydrolase [Bacteroidaceae bacterium]
MVNGQCSKLAERAIELLCRLIETPRVSREEKAAADLLQAYMQDELGLEVRREGNNLWSLQPNFDATKPTLLLNAHIDTVKPVSGWQRDPFKATREGSRIYGLGSNDDGASLVSLLHVFAALTQISSPLGEAGRGLNLVFLASAEEEVSGKGGIESVLPLLPKIDVALVGEPTGMQPAIAEKGLMVLDCTAHGKAGHAARDEGDNAIYHAIDDIEWFRSYKFEKVSSLLGPVKMTVTIVNAGTQHNVVPDTCTFTVDVRSNECYTNRELFDEIGKNVKSEVKARSFRLGSSSIDVNHPLVQKIIGLGGKPFGSPTLSDQALMPFPSLKLGPGESSRSHSADEFVDFCEIEHAIETYLKLLK